MTRLQRVRSAAPMDRERDYITVGAARQLADDARKAAMAAAMTELEKLNRAVVGNFTNLSQETAATVTASESTTAASVLELREFLLEALEVLETTMDNVLEVHALRMRQIEDRLVAVRARRAWDAIAAAPARAWRRVAVSVGLV